MNNRVVFSVLLQLGGGDWKRLNFAQEDSSIFMVVQLGLWCMGKAHGLPFEVILLFIPLVAISSPQCCQSTWNALSKSRIWKGNVSVNLVSSTVTEICWVFKYCYWFFILFQACNNEEDEDVAQMAEEILMIRSITWDVFLRMCDIRINMVWANIGRKSSAVKHSKA